MTAPRDVVLLGAGHAHLPIVRAWRDEPLEGYRLTLVSSFDHAAYSGMLPGTVAGLYPPDRMLVPLGPLVQRAGARLVVDSAIGLDPAARTVTLERGGALPFDICSVNIGSVPAGREVWQRHPQVLSVKPMPTFVERLEAQLERTLAVSRGPLELGIVGAGAAGVELALCLSARLSRDGIEARLRLVDGHAEILRGSVPRLVARARRALERRKVALVLGSRAADYDAGPPGQLRLEDGSTCPADLVIWTTVAAPPPVLERFLLPKDERGFLAVRPTLQTVADAPVFAAGDTASLVGHDVPKAGVYAVRESKYLWHNLRQLAAGKPLVPYKPQRGFLSLIGTGDGRALLEYKGLTSHSRWSWWLKDAIDRRWVSQFVEE